MGDDHPAIGDRARDERIARDGDLAEREARVAKATLDQVLREIDAVGATAALCIAQGLLALRRSRHVGGRPHVPGVFLAFDLQAGLQGPGDVGRSVAGLDLPRLAILLVRGRRDHVQLGSEDPAPGGRGSRSLGGHDERQPGHLLPLQRVLDQIDDHLGGAGGQRILRRRIGNLTLTCRADERADVLGADEHRQSAGIRRRKGVELDDQGRRRRYRARNEVRPLDDHRRARTCIRAEKARDRDTQVPFCKLSHAPPKNLPASGPAAPARGRSCVQHARLRRTGAESLTLGNRRNCG